MIIPIGISILLFPKYWDDLFKDDPLNDDLWDYDGEPYG